MYGNEKSPTLHFWLLVGISPSCHGVSWKENHPISVGPHFQPNLSRHGSFVSCPRATACRDTYSLPRRKGGAWSFVCGKLINSPKEIQYRKFKDELLLDFCLDNLNTLPGKPVRCWWFCTDFDLMAVSWSPKFDYNPVSLSGSQPHSGPRKPKLESKQHILSILPFPVNILKHIFPIDFLEFTMLVFGGHL